MDLEQIFKADQNNIKLFLSKQITINELKEKQTESLKLFRNFLKTNGFPFKGEGMENLYKLAITLALHADIETMTEVLRLIENKDNQNIDLRDKAYLIDKIRVLNNQPQLYGTQFKRLSPDKIEFIEIEDSRNVDERRKALLMESLEEYEDFATGKNK